MAVTLTLSLLLTLVMEGFYGLLWGLRCRRDWLLLLLVNGVTNPIVVSVYHLFDGGWPMIAVLEISAVLAEWLAYRRWGRETRPAFLFSLCANGFSFFAGLLLNLIIL